MSSVVYSTPSPPPSNKNTTPTLPHPPPPPPLSAGIFSVDSDLRHVPVCSVTLLYASVTPSFNHPITSPLSHPVSVIILLYGHSEINKPLPVAGFCLSCVIGKLETSWNVT